MTWFQNVQAYISQHAWVNQIFRIVVTIGGLYAIYRFLMSSYAEKLRKNFSPLRLAHSSKEISQLIKQGEYAKAGDRLLQLGEVDRAIEIFQQGKLYGRVGDIYAEKKNLQKAVVMYEKAGDIRKVAEMYLKTRSYDKIEELYQRNGKLPELGLLYQENKKHQRAAELFSKIGDYFRAAENYLQANEEIKTAEMLEKYFYQVWKLESPEFLTAPTKKVSDIAMKAGILYEKHKKWDEVIQLYNKIQHKKGIAHALSQKGEFDKAAKLAEEIGDFKMASELQRKSGNQSDSARLEAEHLFQEGDLLNAIEKFKEANEFSRCAELYAELQEYQKAAEMHERAGEFYPAGRIYMDEKNYLKAGENFEKAQYFDSALAAYKEGKFESKIMEVYTKTGKYFEMADYLVSKKQYDQALAAVEKIRASDPTFRFGQYIRGKIFYDKGDYENAQKLFEESLQDANELTKEDLNTIHYLGLSEQYRNATQFKSLEMLEMKLTQNKVESKSVDKAMNLLKMIQERTLSRVSHQSKIQSWRTSGGMTSSPVSKSKPIFEPNAERRYNIIKEIGRGGMGVVYLAKDDKLDREVALKILPSSIKNSNRIIQTFLREAKSAASLNHPGIVTVFDTGIQEGDYYIAMEYIDGKTLKRILKKKGKFAYPVVLELLKQLLTALDYAHSKMVIHRDLTTSNIMWTRQKLIKIMDFGLAKVIHNLQSEQSIIGGTPSFMSPEQTLGKPADHRTDIYSLGICIFEMALGTLPFSKGDLGYHHLHTAPPIPKEIDPSIPDAINDAILRCMQKKPEDRFQNVQEIIKALSLG